MVKRKNVTSKISYFDLPNEVIVEHEPVHKITTKGSRNLESDSLGRLSYRSKDDHWLFICHRNGVKTRTKNIDGKNVKLRFIRVDNPKPNNNFLISNDLTSVGFNNDEEDKNNDEEVIDEAKKKDDSELDVEDIQNWVNELFNKLKERENQLLQGIISYSIPEKKDVAKCKKP